MANDLISRQAAIDAIYRCTDIYVGNLPIMVDKEDAYKAIAQLPSAQPDRRYIEQIKWERDMAIKQLKDLGYGLGEKIRTDGISRKAAIDALNQIFDRCEEIEAHLPEGDPDRIGYKMYPDYITVWKYLHQLPSAQPERKIGRWIPVTNGRGGHECDQCHEYAPSWATGEEHLTNYCPNCGAKMEAEK